MALLNQLRERISLRHGERAKTLSLALMIITLSGCVLFQAFKSKEKRFAFTHSVHVTDQGIACVDCHRKTTTDDQPGLPSLKPCLLCHEEMDSKKPPERKVETLFEAKQFRAAHAEKLPAEVIFSHKKHVTNGIECNVCHPGIEKNSDVLDLEKPTMDMCTKCHDDRKVASACTTCHSQIREDVAPPSHEKLWTRRHGMVVRAGADKTEERCALCHQDSKCISCHESTPPDNHTNYWRERGHAASAAIDRQSCAVCHRSDTCERCHSESQPLNHTGAWGAPLDRHCLSCHFPLQMEGCAVCHKSTPSHSLAAPKPSWHLPSMDCRQCHGHGQPLPHVDNGDDCNMCHM